MDTLLSLALDLTLNLKSKDRIERLLFKIRENLKADAAALLLVDHNKVRIRASQGILPNAANKAWQINEQPRLTPNPQLYITRHLSSRQSTGRPLRRRPQYC